MSLTNITKRTQINFDLVVNGVNDLATEDNSIALTSTTNDFCLLLRSNCCVAVVMALLTQTVQSTYASLCVGGRSNSQCRQLSRSRMPSNNRRCWCASRREWRALMLM
jgi:hypothetical protein